MTEMVDMDTLAAVSGYGGNELRFPEIVKELTGMDITRDIAKDWRGRDAVPVTVAAEVTSAVTGAVAQHNANWDRYQGYLRDRDERARAERDAIAARQRTEAAESHQKKSKAAQEAYERAGVAHVREEREKARRKAGNPLEFRQFVETPESLRDIVRPA